MLPPTLSTPALRNCSPKSPLHSFPPSSRRKQVGSSPLPYETARPTSFVVAGSAHPLLPDVHLSVHTSLVPFHAYLFRVCTTGHSEAWPAERPVPRHSSHFEMPSMGRKRLRSRSVKKRRLMASLLLSPASLSLLSSSPSYLSDVSADIVGGGCTGGYFSNWRLSSCSSTCIWWMAMRLRRTRRSPCGMPSSMSTALMFSMFARQMSSFTVA